MSESQDLKPFSSTAGVLREPHDPAFEADFADLAARFAAKSGGGLSAELSADLALEIVLNEIVEQACQVTRATGAAIVLDRDGEMVCRASSGTTAPELGSRLDTQGGLSGECVRTRRTQWCDDVRTDSRADVEASERLGVRSVVVMPLSRGDALIGVFELFSTQPYAFGVRDERALEALTDHTLSNLEQASRAGEAETVLPGSDMPEIDLQHIRLEDDLLSAIQLPDLNPQPIHPRTTESNKSPEPVRQTMVVQAGDDVAAKSPLPKEVAVKMDSAPPKVAKPQNTKSDSTDESDGEPHYRPANGVPRLAPRFDFLTGALLAATLITAILLGLVMGRHLMLTRAGRRTAANRTAESDRLPNPATEASSNDSANTEGDISRKASSARTSSATATTSSPTANSVSASPSDHVPPGGLVVFQDGKEIFRMPPTKDPGDGSVAQPEQVPASDPDLSPHSRVIAVPPAMAEHALLRRVEPEYPDAAREQRVSGPVVLDLRIGTDGSVDDVQVVSGPALLAQASTDAVRKWKFKPEVVNGSPVEMQTRITLDFSLPR